MPLSPTCIMLMPRDNKCHIKREREREGGETDRMDLIDKKRMKDFIGHIQRMLITHSIATTPVPVPTPLPPHTSRHNQVESL